MTWNTNLVKDAGDGREQHEEKGLLDFVKASEFTEGDETEVMPHITNVEKPHSSVCSWTTTESTGDEYGTFDPFNDDKHLCNCDEHADPKTPRCRHIDYIRTHCTPFEDEDGDEPEEFDPDELDPDERAEWENHQDRRAENENYW